MYTYSLGLCTGGLMEDPDWHLEDIRTVTADSIEVAKDIWAKTTHHDTVPNWNPKTHTYWGWSVKLTYTDDPRVDKDDFFRGHHARQYEDMGR